MASKQMLIIFAVVMAISVLPMITLAKTFTVGDGQGWTTGFDYQAWAKDKKIRVGDTLVFKYSKGAHNVQKVDGNGFDKCIKPSLNEALTTGNDAIRLTSIGKKWYICGVGNHCQGGQKLVITVAIGKKHKGGSKNSGNGIAKSWIQVLTAAVITTTMIVID